MVDQVGNCTDLEDENKALEGEVEALKGKVKVLKQNENEIETFEVAS